MVRISVDLCGLKLRTPIMTAPGPAADPSLLLAAAENGAGALVTNTIVKDPAPIYPYLCKVRDSFLSASLYSYLPPDTWIKEIERIKRTGLPVVASVGFTPDEVVEIGSLAIDAGADAIEVSLTRNIPLTRFREAVREIKKRIPKPVFFKLNLNMENIVEFAKAAEQEGADALTVIDAVGPCLAIRDDSYPFLGSVLGLGWLSGPAIKPLALKAVMEVCSTVKIPVIGAGGIVEGRDVVNFIMLGATAVEVNAAVIARGIKVFGILTKELMQFMQMKGYGSVEEFRGITLKHLPQTPFTSPKLPEVISSRCNSCGLCVGFCIYGAIKLVGKLPKIETPKCAGCGLCISVCPNNALKL